MSALASKVFINELHYDNDGADSGEFVEIAGLAGTDLSGWALVLYNGSNGQVYDTIALSGVLADAGDGVGFSAVTFPPNGIQNGAPDGVALVAPGGSVVQFLSYEGALQATDGPATGMTSMDIGVAESSATPVGSSLQVQGLASVGAAAVSFDSYGFAAPQSATPGAVNTGQYFVTADPETFTLELLHFADQEAASAAVIDAPKLSAVLNALRAQDIGADGEADNTITISSGDAFIPGVFFDASETVFGSAGIADIQIQNELGVQAITLGNHEFDLGTATLAGLIDGSAAGDFSALSGTALDGLDFEGALFPYLSANLDFSTDASLAPLEVAGGQAPLPNVVTSSTVLTTGAELIGVVGATTPTLASISSPGSVGIAPSGFPPSPTEADIDALAAEIQAEVDALLAANPGMNKIVLSAHMQRLDIERALAEKLTDVDIVIGGGSNTRLFDDNDRARDGDSDQGQYPEFITNAGGTQTALVNTDGSYVGRLVIDFDASGNIIADSYDADVSGAYATDAQGVSDLSAEGLIDPEIQAIADAIEAQIVATDGNVFGVSTEFLNGNRSGGPTDGVRTQETNLGNLTADANLAAAQAVDAETVVAIKNGGGIRASIGETVVLPGGTEAVRLANGEIVDGDGNVVKPEGGISQTDIQTTLAFNNDLVLLTVTKAELVALLEHGVSALPGVAGQFPQVSGVQFSFDENLDAGDRILNAGIFHEDGNLIAELVRAGEISGDPAQEFRITTLGFLASPRFNDAGEFIGGGDGYPFPNSNTDPLVGEVGTDAARINLVGLEVEGSRTGDAVFADDGTEQDALAEYLDDNFNPENGGVAFGEIDGAQGTDERIQNVAFRADTVFDGITFNPAAPVATEELGEISEFANFETLLEGGSEVVVYEDGQLYTTNGASGAVDVWDLATKSLVQSIDLTFLPGFDGLQSVAVKNGLIAAAISTPDVTTTAPGLGAVTAGQNGYVVLIDGPTGQVIDRVAVGNLPDMLTFNADGTRIVVANEGEFTGESTLDVDPIGSISVIDVSDLIDPTVMTLDFSAIDGLEAQFEAAGIRLGRDASLLRGLEPEYISIEGDLAYVSLQEANAIAVFDIVQGTLSDLFSLGTVDHALEGFEIDANDDGEISIRTFDNLVGLRMPDAIDTFTVGGQTYLITANEGDGRGDITDGPGDVPSPARADEARVGDILAGEVAGVSIDDSVDTEGLERLTISLTEGDTDGDGDIDVLHAFGSRSFTIFDTSGNVVFDSGSQFEVIIAELAPERFNIDDGDPIAEEDDNRSDAKGPEPEAVTTGVVNGSLYAFIGLERDSGIVIYNIDDPANAAFVDYIPGYGGQSGDHVAPETIAFIPADESASGVAQIAVAYEVSGETVVYDLGAVLAPEITPQISEFQPNPDGADPATVQVELTGMPGAAFDLWLLSVESDSGGSAGTVDRAENVTGTFDANGIAVVTVPDLENPSFTYILADDFTGTVGQTDFDTDDDGVPDDLSTLGQVFDAIGVPDTAGEPLYGAAAGGTDLTFATGEPQLLFRDGATGDIYRVEDGLIFDADGTEIPVAEFDVDPTQTSFGGVNPIRTGPQPDLQITEMWAGQSGTDLTDDWFEITNVGSVAWTSDLGALFYDDESSDVGDADGILGITEIAAGESVIVTIGNETGVAEFRTVWGDTVADVQVGYTDGAGLGGGGDAVTLFLDTDGTLEVGDIVDTEAYPDTEGADALSWDVENAQFSEVGALTNVVATTPGGGDNADVPAVGSPGSLTSPISSTPVTLISAIQGSSSGVTQVTVDDGSALAGQTVTISAVVTADFQNGLGGFFVQEEDADQDGDASTSEGIFVFTDDAPVAVSVGDVVTIEGTVAEAFGQTQITAGSVAVTGTAALPTATIVDLGATGAILTDDGDYVVNLEAVEGMLITIPEDLVVSEMFNLDRFGEYRVSSEGRPFQFTQQNAPDVEGYDAHLQDIAARSLVLDDGSTVQNPAALEIIDGNNGVLDASDSFRMGDTLNDVTGVVRYGFDAFRLDDATGSYTETNPRPETPEAIDGNFKVASFNVLNYFTTLDEGGNTTGPDGTLEPRGADSAAEFERQAEKIVEAIIEVDADVLGLVEIENNNDVAIADLVGRINTALGSAVYDYIPTGFTGTDAITNGIIYKTATATPAGDVAVLTEFEGQSFLDPLDAGRGLNRPAVTQTFEDASSGQLITVSVNHFKSKGSLSGLEEDTAQGGGAGNNDATRAEASAVLAAWLATDPTGTGAENQLIIGDLNAYAKEAPIATLEAAGFTDVAQALLGSDVYSYVFDGQIGTLDYIMANGPAFDALQGVTEWHINADEADAIDYNLDFGRDPTLFNGDTPARNSDHDPVVAGFTFEPADGGLAEADMYEVTAEALASEGISWFRLGAISQNSTVLQNDATTSTIALVNGAPIEPGVWFDGDSGGQFRIFEGGVFDFRNQGDKVAEGDTTGFSYTVVEDGVPNAAAVSLTVTSDTGPAQDNTFNLSGSDLDSAGSQFLRLAAINDGTGLLFNDDGADEIFFVNGLPLKEGVWFDGDNGGQFRVFEGGVTDFRNLGEAISAGDTTGFTYEVLEDGVYDTARVTLNIFSFVVSEAPVEAGPPLTDLTDLPDPIETGGTHIGSLTPPAFDTFDFI